MNTLYILRLVIKDQTAWNGATREQHNLQVDYLRAVILIAQAEAAEWGYT